MPEKSHGPRSLVGYSPCGCRVGHNWATSLYFTTTMPEWRQGAYGIYVYLLLDFAVNLKLLRGFPDSSAGKESACNAGDSGSIPGSGRFSGEGKGYPLQCSWASLVAQLLKNPPAMWETWVWYLGWEDTLKKGNILQYSGLENSTDHKELDTTEWLSLHSPKGCQIFAVFSNLFFFSSHTHTHTPPLMKVINIPVLIFHFSLFNLVTLSF